MSELVFWRVVVLVGEVAVLAYAAAVITVVLWRRARR